MKWNLMMLLMRILLSVYMFDVSSGNTPGKPDRKTRRLSRNATSSRALFQSSGTSPKTTNKGNVFICMFHCESVMFIFIDK